MKKNIFLSIISAFLLLHTMACKNDHQTDNLATNPMQSVYDSINAEKFGADKYGMKKYVIAFLKRGPNRDLDSTESRKLQMAHLKNIDNMAEQGKLVLAGPFLDDGDLRGIYIFNVKSITEAEELTISDPAIKAGSLVMELKEWYGSAALMAINDIHKSLSEKDITE